MTDRYACTGFQTVVETTPGEAVMNLYSPGTTHRGAIYYMAVSAGGTMADALQAAVFARTTVGGTGESPDLSPTALDFDAPAAILQFEQDHSAEPTYTANEELWEEDVHVRALAQIQLQPDGHLIVPAVADAGIALTTFSAAYGGIAHGTMHFHE